MYILYIYANNKQTPHRKQSTNEHILHIKHERALKNNVGIHLNLKHTRTEKNSVQRVSPSSSKWVISCRIRVHHPQITHNHFLEAYIYIYVIATQQTIEKLRLTECKCRRIFNPLSAFVDQHIIIFFYLCFRSARALLSRDDDDESRLACWVKGHEHAPPRLRLVGTKWRNFTMEKQIYIQI